MRESSIKFCRRSSDDREPSKIVSSEKSRDFPASGTATKLAGLHVFTVISFENVEAAGLADVEVRAEFEASRELEERHLMAALSTVEDFEVALLPAEELARS